MLKEDLHISNVTPGFIPLGVFFNVWQFPRFKIDMIMFVNIFTAPKEN